MLVLIGFVLMSRDSLSLVVCCLSLPTNAAPPCFFNILTPNVPWAFPFRFVWSSPFHHYPTSESLACDMYEIIWIKSLFLLLLEVWLQCLIPPQGWGKGNINSKRLDLTGKIMDSSNKLLINRHTTVEKLLGGWTSAFSRKLLVPLIFRYHARNQILSWLVNIPDENGKKIRHIKPPIQGFMTKALHTVGSLNFY